ncbi:hypothetical protein YQE_07241, partial [Dendroctonus ponderosae]
MSAGVSDQAKCPLNKLSLLQRMKGQGNQVSNGSKEPIGAAEGATGSEGFEPWRTQQQNSAAHTGYGPSVPISSATDLYNMSTAVGLEVDPSVSGVKSYVSDRLGLARGISSELKDLVVAEQIS